MALATAREQGQRQAKAEAKSILQQAQKLNQIKEKVKAQALASVKASVMPKKGKSASLIMRPSVSEIRKQEMVRAK